jgi:hypothetical protein
MQIEMEVQVMDEAMNVNQLLDDLFQMLGKNMKVRGLQDCFQTIM